MKFIRRKIVWEKQDVGSYGGDGEYAGSFENPDFVDIQRAAPGDCVVAKHRETGHWYWFRQDDTLLPWMKVRDREGACEVHDRDGVSFLPAGRSGPFATEKGAKEFGESFSREEIFAEGRDQRARKRFEKAREALVDLLKYHKDK